MSDRISGGQPELSYSLAEVATEMIEYINAEYENMKDGFKKYWKNP